MKSTVCALVGITLTASLFVSATAASAEPDSSARNGETARTTAVQEDRASEGATLNRSRKLVFQDNFNGRRLDARKWGTRFQRYHGSRQCAQPAANRVKVGGGVATLSVKKLGPAAEGGNAAKCRRIGVYDNAMISTANGSSPFRMRYGTLSARVAFQRSKGMLGAVWLQGPPVKGAEIDVVEHFGVGAKPTLSSRIHYTRANGSVATSVPRANGGELKGKLGKRSSTSFNVYTVDWTPKKYIFRINGKKSFETSRPHMSNQKQEVILSLLTSDYARENGRKITHPKSTMRVDWVKVWARR